MTGHTLPFPDPKRGTVTVMGLAPQTLALFQAAKHLVQTLPADAVLLYTETDLDWDARPARDSTAAAFSSPPRTSC